MITRPFIQEYCAVDIISNDKPKYKKKRSKNLRKWKKGKRKSAKYVGRQTSSLMQYSYIRYLWSFLFELSHKKMTESVSMSKYISSDLHLVRCCPWLKWLYNAGRPISHFSPFLNLFHSIYKSIIFLSVKLGNVLKFRLELILRKNWLAVYFLVTKW